MDNLAKEIEDLKREKKCGLIGPYYVDDAVHGNCGLCWGFVLPLQR